MENQTGLELSLRRVALLGSEVLDRASRRRVDWTPSGPPLRPLTTDQKHGQDDPLEVRQNHSFGEHLTCVTTNVLYFLFGVCLLVCVCREPTGVHLWSRPIWARPLRPWGL